MKTTPKFEVAANQLIAAAASAYLKMTGPHVRPFLPCSPDDPISRSEWNAIADQLAKAIENFSEDFFDDEGGASA